MDKKASNESNKKNNNKLVIKDPKKLIISITIFLIVIIAIVIIIFSNTKVDLANENDYSKLNSKKYSEELLKKYETEESKKKFLEDYDYVQGAVGIYIMNNSTTDNDSFSKIIEDLKAKLKKDNWNELDIDKPIFWNGSFDVTDEGIVTFKFGSKDIEPSWVNDEEINNKIILNS